MDALGLLDQSVHIILLPDDGLKVIGLPSASLPGQVQLQVGKALEAQFSGKPDYSSRRGAAGCGELLDVHMDDFAAVGEQIVGQACLSLGQASHALFDQKCTAQG